MDEVCANFVTKPRRLHSQPKPLQIKPKWVETLGTINRPAPSGKKKDVHKKSREFVEKQSAKQSTALSALKEAVLNKTPSGKNIHTIWYTKLIVSINLY